eukprot:14635378-Alexandrium_andersonii.AAC.1
MGQAQPDLCGLHVSTCQACFPEAGAYRCAGLPLVATLAARAFASPCSAQCDRPRLLWRVQSSIRRIRGM